MKHTLLKKTEFPDQINRGPLPGCDLPSSFKHPVKASVLLTEQSEDLGGILVTAFKKNRVGDVPNSNASLPDRIVVFNTMKTIFDTMADDATRNIYKAIEGEMNIVGWEDKGMVRKEMENKIIKVLQPKMERSNARQKAKELVELIAKNKHA